MPQFPAMTKKNWTWGALEFAFTVTCSTFSHIFVLRNLKFSGIL